MGRRVFDKTEQPAWCGLWPKGVKCLVVVITTGVFA